MRSYRFNLLDLDKIQEAEIVSPEEEILENNEESSYNQGNEEVNLVTESS